MIIAPQEQHSFRGLLAGACISFPHLPHFIAVDFWDAEEETLLVVVEAALLLEVLDE